MTVTYVTPDAPMFSMRVMVDGKDVRVQFTNKELHLDEEKNAALIAVLDELIKTKPNISILVKKVDIEEALRIAEAHKALMLSQRGTLTGSVSSSDADQIGKANLARQEQELRFKGASEAQIAAIRDEMKQDNVEFTEDAADKIEPSNREGFIADEIEDPPEGQDVAISKSEPEANPKAVFANLASKGESKS